MKEIIAVIKMIITMSLVMIIAAVIGLPFMLMNLEIFAILSLFPAVCIVVKIYDYFGIEIDN